MRGIVLQAGPLLACFCFLFFLAAGCSKESAREAGEKGAVERLTDRTAETAVQKIRTPLDKARAAADAGEEREAAMERAVRQQ